MSKTALMRERLASNHLTELKLFLKTSLTYSINVDMKDSITKKKLFINLFI